MAGQVKKWNYSASYNRLSSNGFSAATDERNAGDFDNDGYRQDAMNARLGYQANEALRFGAFFNLSDYDTDIDNGAFTDDKDYTSGSNNLSTGMVAEWRRKKTSLRFNYLYGKTKRNLLDDSTDVGGFAKYSTNDFEGDTHFAELYGNFKFSHRWQLVAGADYRWAAMNSRLFSISSFGPFVSVFSDTSIQQFSAYASLLFGSEAWNVEGGIRFNQHERYGSNATFTFNPTYRINQHWRLLASVASGFKAPSIFQLYSTFGNPELKPETSVNTEAGVAFQKEKWNSRLVYFFRDITNGLDFDNANFVYFNAIRQKVHGLELELTWSPVKKFNLSANYTWLSPEEQAQSRLTNKDTIYGYLLRRPQHQVQASISWMPVSAFTATIHGRYVSKRYDVGGFRRPDVEMDDYFLLGLNVAYQFSRHLSAFADLQNAANVNFVEINGFNSMPRNLQAGARIQF